MKNKKVILLSIIGIISLILTFTIHWIFIIIAVIVMLMNQRELFAKGK